jgi:hypothetical protein
MSDSVDPKARPRRQMTPEYRTWVQMRSRCRNANDPTYQHYGARGIRVCERWDSVGGFERFLADMGPRPPGMNGGKPAYSIDRIDNARGYSPDNCRWATLVAQGRNKRNNRLLSHGGEVLSIADWSDRTGLPTDAIRARLKRGWSVDRTLTEPLQLEKQNRRTSNVPRLEREGATRRARAAKKRAQTVVNHTEPCSDTGPTSASTAALTPGHCSAPKS